MLIAVVSVSILIAITLGLRESLIVFIAIPVTLALTLAVFYLYGYTLNRITLFALIFSIGILVDDAIVVVENIVRHWRMPANRERPPYRRRHRGRGRSGQSDHPRHAGGGRGDPADGVRGRTDGAVHAADSDRRQRGHGVLAAGGLHRHAVGRRPDSRNRAMPRLTSEKEDLVTRVYRRVMGTILHRARLRWGFLLGVVVLLLGSVSLFYFQFVKVKMLPFDNKSEFQVMSTCPNGTTLEQTARAAARWRGPRSTSREVVNSRPTSGTASPFNFNGLVRHYYLRRGSNVADIQVNLLPKGERKLQSHEIARQVRQRLLPVAARYGARIKVAEVPPGPPVLQTLVAEVYGPELSERIGHRAAHPRSVERTDGVVDVDWYVEDDQPKYRLIVDKEKAALNGISEDDIAETMALASAGYQAGLLHVDSREGRYAADAAARPRHAVPTWRRIQDSESRRTDGPAGGLSELVRSRGRRWRTRASITRI